MGLLSLPTRPHVHLSALPPKYFPNPVTSLYLWGHQPSPCYLQPPPWPPAAIRLLQSVLLQAARRIFLKLQITCCHSPNLLLASTSDKTHTPPHSPQGGRAPETSRRYLRPSLLPHLSQPQPPLHGSSNMASLFPPQDLCTCSYFWQDTLPSDFAVPAVFSSFRSLSYCHLLKGGLPDHPT